MKAFLKWQLGEVICFLKAPTALSLNESASITQYIEG
jgi:hypothetical protein